MSDTIYTYYRAPLSKRAAIMLGYISPKWESKLDYDCKIEGRICVRIERPPLNTPGIQEYNISYSFCSPSDNFNRKLARAISSGRPKLQIRSEKPLRVNEISKMAIGFLSEACNGEKSVLDNGNVKIKIPNWLSRDGVIIPEYRSK